MAELDLGQSAYGEGASVTYEAGGDISAGDAVGINGGTLATADGTTDTVIVGIAADDAASGDNVKVWTHGCVVANVAADISAGAELGTSATEGQLGTGTGGIVALTDEGGVAGLSHGSSVPDNAAVVKL